LSRSIIEIQSFPRIHMTLLDMNGGFGNVNGGIGFAINFPSNRIRIQGARKNMINWPTSSARDVQHFIGETANRVAKLKRLGRYEIDIRQSVPSHHGFGSFTSSSLSVVEGLLLHNSVPYTREEIVSLSHRGGTSGVGVNTYFEGKMTIDLGHCVSENLRASNFTPSSSSWKRGPAMKLATVKVPAWPILLVLPKARTLSEEEEISFFRRTCPIPRHEVAKTIHLCVFGILPAVMTGDYARFCRMVRELKNTFWKKSEIRLYREQVIDIIRRAEEIGADAASMSSLGPLVYCLIKRRRINFVRRRLEKEFDLAFTGLTFPRNEGRGIVVSK